MNLPFTRQRTIHEDEIDYVDEAIRLSGLPGGFVELAWQPHTVTFNGAVELHAALYDCREPLATNCWTIRRLSAPDPVQPCCCGALAREAAAGSYGSLRAAVAAALGELVRVKVLDALTDTTPIIPRDRPIESPTHTRNDILRT